MFAVPKLLVDDVRLGRLREGFDEIFAFGDGTRINGITLTETRSRAQAYPAK